MMLQDKAFKINNTPKVIKHQAALPKVPTYFWQDWHSKVTYFRNCPCGTFIACHTLRCPASLLVITRPTMH
jgi:hypothetical protein